MDYISHTVAGVVVGVGTVYALGNLGLNVSIVPIVAGAVGGSLLPDIDHPKSFLGNKVKILSNALYTSVGHRSLTHSLLFAGVVGIIVSLFNAWLGLGIVLGILSHILLDMFTGAGVAYLYPFKKSRIKWFKI